MRVNESPPDMKVMLSAQDHIKDSLQNLERRNGMSPKSVLVVAFVSTGIAREFSFTGEEYIDASSASLIVRELVLPVPTGISAEMHGHSVILRVGTERVADILFSANRACSLQLRPGDSVSAQVIVLSLPVEDTNIRITVHFDDFPIIERGVGVAPGWRRTSGQTGVNYLIDAAPSASGSEKLIVVFSAIAGPLDFTYNYRSSVRNIDAHRLFILDDFGERGSYYSLDHRDTRIYEAVQDCIRATCQEFNIDISNAVFAGSSKGGTAALIHGVSLGAKLVLAGAPQYRVGDYLAAAAPKILGFMCGETPDAQEWLNAQLPRVLKAGQKRTAIRLIVGSKDHHLQNHVRPLVADAEELGYSVASVVLPNLRHQDIGEVFKCYLNGQAAAYAAGSEHDPWPYELIVEPGAIVAKFWMPSGDELALELHNKEGRLTSMEYSTEQIRLIPVPLEGSYRLRVFRRSRAFPASIGAFTTQWCRVR